MLKARIALILATAWAGAGTAAAQEVAPTAQGLEDSAAPDRGPDNPDLSLPSVPRACRDEWRCPDAASLDSEPTELAQNILPPAGDPPPAEATPPPTAATVADTATPANAAIDPTAATAVDPATDPVLVVPGVRRAGRGFRAPPGSAPWMAQLQRPARMPQLTRRMLDWEDRQWCGGAYIAPGWIVTAAHCLNDNGADIKAAGYRVRLGVSDISRGETGVTYRIVATYRHTDYDPKRYLNDIALIRFAADDATERGRRIWAQSISVDSAPPTARQFGGSEAWFYGWGRTEHDKPSAPLLYGRVRLQPDTGCQRSGIALCGQGYGATGSTQCHGDSGGPLVWWDNTTPVLVGVVSHNTDVAVCGQQRKPGVFTRISSYKSWIEGLTGPLRAVTRP